MAAARAAYVAGFATHLQPRGPAALRRTDGRHLGALVHAAARHRGGRVPGAGDLPGRRHHAARRHLRRRRGGAARRRDRRPGARRGPPRLRRPRRCWPGRCAPSSTRSGRPDTRIMVTSDLDEYAIAALASAPVDGYGVGTQLVTGSGHPTSGLRLQAGRPRGRRRRELVSVAKKSIDKISIGGRKFALRRRDPDGVAEAEVVGIGDAARDDGDDRAAARPAGPRRRGGRPRAARRRARPSHRRPRRAAARSPADARGEPVIQTALRQEHGTEHGPDQLRLLLRDARGRHLADRRPSPADGGADRRRLGADRQRRATGALPAARALRRPHRLAALHLHRALRDGARAGRGDAGGAPVASTPTRRTATPTGTSSPRSCPRSWRRSSGSRRAGGHLRGGACRWAATARSSSALTHPERYAAVGQPLRRGRRAQPVPAASNASRSSSGSSTARSVPATTSTSCSTPSTRRRAAALHLLRHRGGPADGRQHPPRRAGHEARARRHHRLPARRSTSGGCGTTSSRTSSPGSRSAAR